MYLLYLVNIDVGYFFIGSFDNFQDNFDHFKVTGVQLTEYPIETESLVHVRKSTVSRALAQLVSLP